MDKYLTVNQVAELLQCHPQSVYRNKELPFILIPRIGKRIKVDDLNGYIEHKKKGEIPDKFLYNQSFNLTSSPGFDKQKLSKSGGICEMAKAKTKTRYNFGYGAIYQRKTRKGKIRWYLDYREASGKRIQKVVLLASTKEEAEFALRDEIRKVFDHEYRVRREKKRIKFKDLAEDYLENYAKVNKKSWKDDYYRLRSSIIPYFGEIELSEITPLMIEKYKAKRLKEKISRSTVNREISIIRKMFNLAIDWKMSEENPVSKIRFFSEKDTLKERILDPEEEDKLLCEANDYLKLILIMALNTGMRQGEILKLKWEHVDFKEKHIIVKKTKSGENRIVPINKVLFNELLNIRKSARRTPFVFPNPKTGKPYTELKKSFKSACKRAGVENLRFHDLRHTFATRLVQSGVDLITVRDLLGHFSIRVTQRYTHSNRDQKINAVELLKHNKAEKVGKITDNLLHICDIETKKKTGKIVSSSYLIN